ncbi:MAG TPA: IS630 transposase-related protein [Geminicoccaceae bacterium]|nr:IS630 transposase-related protein [Geminicoccaceae bacterium]
MPRAYSSDLRERVVTDCEAGLGRAEAARRYRLGERTVYRWLAEARHEGRRHAKPHAGGRRPVVAGTEDVLHELATAPATGDATLAEQVELYEARTGRKLSAATLCRAFQRLGLTRKKDAARHRAGSGGGPGRAGDVRRTGARSRPEPAGVRR